MDFNETSFALDLFLSKVYIVMKEPVDLFLAVGKYFSVLVQKLFAVPD